jgi:tetraacyldisaccharide 4'-kinase
MKWLVNTWYQPHPIRWLLAPLSALYRLVITLRKRFYQLGIFKQEKQTVPVIVVGNLAVGGTGKTPFVIWLVKQLKQAGYQPGIISRGYGGSKLENPTSVSSSSNARIVGDEPVLIASETDCPVVVFPNRTQACHYLLSEFDCDIIIADDGLQHYALARDIEIVIVDDARQFGNQYCLPAGPLREPLSRLDSVNFMVVNGGTGDGYNMQLKHMEAINLQDSSQQIPLSAFQNKSVNAVAGIGNPSRFFNQLREQQITVIEHPFADHHPYSAEDLHFANNAPVLMTQKDAVKCQTFATDNMWYVKTQATISDSLLPLILQHIVGIKPNG